MRAQPGENLTRQLALHRPQGLLRDRQFWLALALPLGFWLVMRQAFTVQTIPHSAAFWLSQILLAPIVEELIFRGWLQGSLLGIPKMQRRWAGISLANMLTAVIFSAAHFFTHPPIWAAGVMVPALIFGYFRERHASIYPAIVLHVYYNGGYFIFLE